jgi:hypothetical protein
MCGMMPETGEHRIESTSELRRNLGRANMDGPLKDRVGGARKGDEPHSHSDCNELTEPPADD